MNYFSQLSVLFFSVVAHRHCYNPFCYS